jgi:hypothetical protein
VSQPSPRRAPLLLKQVFAQIDARTTVVCLDAAGQIVPVDDDFETLNGRFYSPPFHIHCRDTVVPWLPGMVSEQRAAANRELKKRPLKQRRKGPNGYEGRLPPPPDPGPRPQFVHPDDPRVPAPPLGRRDRLLVLEEKARKTELAPEERTEAAALLETRVRSLFGFEPFRSMSAEELQTVLDILLRPGVYLFAHLPEWLRRAVLRAEKAAGLV